MDYDIMIVKIDSRRAISVEVQEVLSKYGCSIKTRIGLHEAGNTCTDEGILVLHMAGDHDETKMLEAALNRMDGVKAKVVEI